MDAMYEFMGGGTPSVKFNNLEDQVVGTICGEPQRKQRTDMKDGKPRYFDNGEPMYVWLFPLATDQRESEDDDGRRTLWVGWEMQKAIMAAIKKAGCKSPQEGGHLTVTFSDEQETKYRTKQKLFTAEYKPPADNTFMATPDFSAEDEPSRPIVDAQALKAALAAMSAEQRKAAGLE